MIAFLVLAFAAATRAASSASQLPVVTDAPVIDETGNPFNTLYNPQYTLATPDTSLISFCSASFDSYISSFYATQEVSLFTSPEYTLSGGFQTYTYGDSTGGTHITTYTQLPTTQAAEVFQLYTADFTATEGLISSPCCLDCTLFGGTVQVYYWPTATLEPTLQPRVHELISSDSQITTVVNSNGYTFTSPSIYVEFQSLYATDLCGTVGNFYSTPRILAFEPGQLSTAMAYSYDRGEWSVDIWMPDDFQEAAWSDATNCGNITSTLWEIANVPGTTYTNAAAASSAMWLLGGWSDYVVVWTITYNPCMPTLSVPTQIFTMDSHWKSCKAGMKGFLDPPSALTAATAVIKSVAAIQTTGTSTSSTPVVQSTSQTSATPGLSPVPTTATPTAIPESTPTSTSISSSSSSSSSSTSTSSTVDPQSTQPASQPDERSSSYYSSTEEIPLPQSSDALPTTSTQAPPSTTIILDISPETATDPANTPEVLESSSSTSSPISSAAPVTSYQIASQTLIAGGQAITVSNTQISLQSGGSSVVIGDVTQPVSILTQSFSVYTPIPTDTLPTTTLSTTALVNQQGTQTNVPATQSTQAALSKTVASLHNTYISRPGDSAGSSSTSSSIDLGAFIASLGGFALPSTQSTTSSSSSTKVLKSSTQKGGLSTSLTAIKSGLKSVETSSSSTLSSTSSISTASTQESAGASASGTVFAGAASRMHKCILGIVVGILLVMCCI